MVSNLFCINTEYSAVEYSTVEKTVVEYSTVKKSVAGKVSWSIVQ